MRIHIAIIQLVLATCLSSCDQQHSSSGIDPKLGLGCYESHRATLPPGTQYEGIERLSGNRLTIKIMNGVDVVKLDCGLNPDGTTQVNGN